MPDICLPPQSMLWQIQHSENHSWCLSIGKTSFCQPCIANKDKLHWIYSIESVLIHSIFAAMPQCCLADFTWKPTGWGEAFVLQIVEQKKTQSGKKMWKMLICDWGGMNFNREFGEAKSFWKVLCLVFYSCCDNEAEWCRDEQELNLQEWMKGLDQDFAMVNIGGLPIGEDLLWGGLIGG